MLTDQDAQKLVGLLATKQDVAEIKDATHREKYLKTHYGKMFLKNRLKSYLTG